MKVRQRWVERMWVEVRKEVMQPKEALDERVAAAIRRLWAMEDGGQYLRSWADDR